MENTSISQLIRIKDEETNLHSCGQDNSSKRAKHIGELVLK